MGQKWDQQGSFGEWKQAIVNGDINPHTNETILLYWNSSTVFLAHCHSLLLTITSEMGSIHWQSRDTDKCIAYLNDISIEWHNALTMLAVGIFRHLQHSVRVFFGKCVVSALSKAVSNCQSLNRDPVDFRTDNTYAAVLISVANCSPPDQLPCDARISCSTYESPVNPVQHQSVNA